MPREVLRVKALVHALAWSNDRLLVGTGPEGQLYEVQTAARRRRRWSSWIIGQILSLLAEPDGGILMGTGDPGSVVKLVSGHAAAGQLVSEIHDTKLVSRFGCSELARRSPPGTSISLQARSGQRG